MSLLVCQTFCRILLVQQIKNRMELALLHFKIVVLDVGNELGYVCVLRHIVAIGHYAQMGFGS